MKFIHKLFSILFFLTITFSLNAQFVFDSIIPTDVTDCFGGSDGTITVNVSGGTPPYLYSIDGTTFQASNVFNGLSSGTYTVYARDIFQTIISPGPVFIGEPTEILINSELHTDVIGCFGNTNGTITVTASGGTGILSYSIDNGATYPYISGNTVGGLGAGIYNIKVRDANMCVKNGQALTILQPDELIITDEYVTDVLGCFGEDNGTIDIIISGGTFPIEYSINGGATYQAGHFFSPLAPGNYPVVVRDIEGCITNGSTLTVNGPSQVTIDSENWTDVNTCFGDHTGTITIVASGGTGLLYYSIDGGVNWQNNGNFIDLFAGTYDIIVRDQNMCTVTGSTIILNEPSQIVIDSEFKTDVTTCFGDATGQIIINAHGGSGALEYSINSGGSYQASNTFNGLLSGSYSTIVRDANLCEQTGQDHLITQPTQLLITEVNTTDVFGCFGDNDGTIHIVTNGGGTPPYSFSIDGGATYPHGNDILNLFAGIYDVYVRDSQNCTYQYISEIVEIDEPEELIITSEIPTDPTCFSGTDGYITVTVSGGSGQIQYSANAGVNYYYGNILSGLSAGVLYEIWVKDDHNCTEVGGNHILGEPTELLIDNIIKQDVNDCFGGINGSITIIASGGTPPYLYSNNGGVSYQASNVFSGLGAGNYQIFIKDANNCLTVGDLVNISQPDVLEVSFQSHINIEGCNGELIGEIHIDALGGTPHIPNGYQYSIDGGTLFFYNDGDFTGLGAGNYNIVVQDENACLANGDMIIINEPEVIVPSLVFQEDVLCFGEATGQINLSATGGQSPLSFSINGGLTYSTGSFFNGLIAGTYQTYVKDHFDCEVIGPLVVISEPSLLNIDAVNLTDVEDCFGDNDGIIEIFASGGVADYMYSVDDGNSYFNNGGLFTNLSPGNYYVRIYDTNFCDAYLDLDGDNLIDTLVITEPPRLIISDIIETNISCFGDDDGTLEVIASGGTGTIYYSIDDGATYPNTTGLFIDLAAGTYIVKVRDDNLCTSDAVSVNIYEPDELIIDTVFVRDEECPGYNNGSIDIFITGGSLPFRYSATGGAPYQSNKLITDLAPGDYIPAVIDTNDCMVTYPTVTIEAAVYSGLFNTDVTEGCSPLDVLFTRAAPGVTYLWDFGDGGTSTTSDSVTHTFYNTTLIPIVYTVTAYSVSPNNCFDTTYADITVYPQPQLGFMLDPAIAYFPESTVTITNTSHPGYINYNWDFGDGTSSILEDPGTHYYDDCGEYLIVMSAENTWCSDTIEQTYIVTSYQPEALFTVDTTQMCWPAIINFENLSEHFESFVWDLDDGSDPLVNIDPTNPYEFNTPGTYNVTLETIGYCDTYDSYTLPITVFQSPVVDFDVSPDTVMLPDQPIHCYNASSEDSDIFFWLFGDGSSSNEENPIHQYTLPGSYPITLIVTSVNKCIDSLTLLTEVIVLPEGEVFFPNAFTPDGDGFNDNFKPAVYNSVKSFKMEIYNRWGERMFYTEDIDTGWNGYHNGSLSLQDVYVWRAEGLYLNGTPFILSGSITLLR